MISRKMNSESPVSMGKVLHGKSVHFSILLKLIQWSLRIKVNLGPGHVVLCREVVLFSEVQNALVLWERYFEECPLQRGCPFLGGSFNLSEVPLCSAL